MTAKMFKALLPVLMVGSATLIALLLVPAMYMILEDLRTWLNLGKQEIHLDGLSSVTGAGQDLLLPPGESTYR